MKFFHQRKKLASFFFLTLICIQLLPLNIALALTSGPSQPEVQSFQPAGTSDMVDIFSGDFSYNIPLFELPGPNGGYPFNLSYQSGINVDQEASWVGLGWNLQPGAINRQMRGLPDEFNGEDKIQTKMSMAPNVTVGMGAGVGVELFGADALSLGIGFSVYQNNYRGAGYSIDGMLGFSKSSASGRTGGIGLNFSLDSNEGISLNPSLSLGNKNVNLGLGIGYNSKEGLTNLSFDSNINSRSSAKTQKDKTDTKYNSFSKSAGATLSFAHPSYTPQITTPMINSSLSATLKVGAAFSGIFGSAYISGFYNEQRLATNKRMITSPAFGYLNYQNGLTKPDALLDINREKDGIVSAISPNLGSPTFTYDIYSVSGQGISGMYRPIRNDIGVAKDQEITSESSGRSGGIDFGPALIHVGVNLSLNYAKSASGIWNNQMTAQAAFTEAEVGKAYEPWYFKSHGEPSTQSINSLNDIGGERAVRVKLEGSGNSAEATNKLQYNNKEPWIKDLPIVSKDQPRKSRNQSIQPYTNQQLLNGTQEVLPQFRIDYLEASGIKKPFTRSVLPSHHTAGYTALTAEGLRYNYGIPAYNFSQEEFTFSVDKKSTDIDRVQIEKSSTASLANDEPKYDHSTSVEKYLRRVKTPAYAHSYLLTSILGPDYVDVTGNGVTEDDLGYWVKFTYKQTSDKNNPYQWRDPFSQAHLQEGWKSDPRDDKGSFTYGTKEVWYLAKAETKSHIATFEMSKRDDSRGALTKLQIPNGSEPILGEYSYRLDKINLYTRFSNGAFPIKMVRFDYDYSQCKNTYNSSAASTAGKLTLKKLWFEYGGSTRGRLNPYVFGYHPSNPDYKMLSYDRWGNYKPNNISIGGVMNNVFPYVAQNPTNKIDIDSYAAAWSLTEIQLPSGGSVKVDYESDDYAFVQHKQAMQMVEVVDPNVTSISAAGSPVFNLSDASPMVRFKLEKPILKNTMTLDGTWQRKEVLKYLDATSGQLYFKYLISLRKPSEEVDEYISGYADIDTTAEMKLEEDASGQFAYGSFYVVKESGQGLRNPFAMRAWQHLRTNQPELANSSDALSPTNDPDAKIRQIMSVGSILDQVKRMFSGFYRFCSDNAWGREVKVGKAWVRLKSPDKKKYGGGLRVKQITMKDNWQHDEEGIYGQVYDYTTLENGTSISSGVACYEPFVGGDENPLRYAKKYTGSVPLRADNNLFFEYPINESYYPGAHVGYSNVTVSSLASGSLASKAINNVTLSDGKSIFPSGGGASFGTSGKTVHEFYTAKDFPVITGETEKENQPYQLSVIVPFIGSISISKLTASQGYSIVTNDMHGKPKKISNYRQTRSGEFEPDPSSWVRYNYANDALYYQQEQALSVANKFVDNSDGTLSIATPAQLADGATEKFTLGQEAEFFMDMRKFEDNSYTGGVRVNVDVLFFLFFTIPAYVQWPSIGQSESQLRTAVTNKVIYKSGILESVEAYDGGSLIKTNNLKWDKLTGAVVLTSVNNNFDAPIFNYNILAYSKYQGMGAAYQNTGLTFTATNVQAVTNQTNQYQFTVKETLPEGSLYPGDEVLLYSSTGSTLVTPLARVVYAGEESGSKRWHVEQALTASSYKALIVRSGYRNQLSVSAGSVTALEDPSLKGAAVKFSKTIQIPK